MTTVTRIFDILDYSKQKYNKEIVFAGKDSGQWQTYSIDDYIELANYVSYGLLSMGIRKGDKIATASNNRPEWNFIDMGIMQMGAIHVPIYTTVNACEFAYILRHSESKLIFVSDKKIYKKILSITDNIPKLEGIYTFNKIRNVPNWLDIVELGKKRALRWRRRVVRIKHKTKENGLATILYTSGTTGVSKGVMLSHKNIISNVKSALQVYPLDEKSRVLSFLPLCHAFERTSNYLQQYKGNSIYYAACLENIPQYLKEINPHGFETVPRLLEKLFDAIMNHGKSLPLLSKIIFFWAVNVGFKYHVKKVKRRFYKLKLKIANKLVFSKWREVLGGNIRFIGVGGAALQTRIEKIFWAAKMPVHQGYGLTETSPLISVNSPEGEGLKFGTVGTLVKNVKVKFASDGEILCKGPNVMLGYYKSPELTQKVLKDGWFHTGDIGVMVDGKFLKITDRKKEMFKTSGGKYIAPQLLENRFKESFFIEQIMVIGENRRFPAALISPDFKYLHNWCSLHRLNFKNNMHLVQLPAVIERFQREINEINKSFSHPEQIKQFYLVPDEWTVETGELTPTLKLRRQYISLKYKKVINKIYEIDAPQQTQSI